MSNRDSQVLGNLNRGRVFVVSAPAGTGKTTLTHLLINEFPCVVQSISFTTRRPREGERDGVDYLFVSKELFVKKVEEGEFLEYAELYGHYYGTSKTWVEKKLNEGKHVILVIDTQGALQLRQHYPATFIFVQPPSIEELRRRLLERCTESKEMIQKRLDWAEKEMERSREYDYRFVNQNLQSAYEILRSILIAEEHRVVPK